MHGRYHVGIKDIQALAGPILRHRIMTNFYAESERINSDVIIEKLLAPEVGAMETVSRRLRDTGHDDLAERVMNAKQTYVDECHAVRREFTDRERR